MAWPFTCELWLLERSRGRNGTHDVAVSYIRQHASAVRGQNDGKAMEITYRALTRMPPFANRACGAGKSARPVA